MRGPSIAANTVSLVPRLIRAHAGLDGAHAHQAARVVAGERDDRYPRAETVALDEVRRDRADNGVRRRWAARSLAASPGAVAFRQRRIPAAGIQVEQVHSGAIAQIDRGRRAGEQRGHKRADQVNFRRVPVASGGVFQILRIWGPVKRSIGMEPHELADTLGPARRRGDLLAFLAGGAVHPHR